MKTDIFEFFCENWIFEKKIWILKSCENFEFFEILNFKNKKKKNKILFSFAEELALLNLVT